MRGVVPFLALYAGYVTFLHVSPGPWHRWKVGREGSPTDPWTGQHILWGVIAQRMGLTLNQLMALGTLNEVGELLIAEYQPHWLWGQPESKANNENRGGRIVFL